MKFKNLTKTELSRDLPNFVQVDDNCLRGFILYKINRATDIQFPLKKRFKPSDIERGIYTEVLNEQANEYGSVARQKLLKNRIGGDYYAADNASFKLHISLNNIGEVDHEVVKGLLKLLADNAHSGSNMAYDFKLVQPGVLQNKVNAPRFKDNDQFTIYFDKYSSIGEMMSLCDKINNYLQRNIPQNNKCFGLNDIIGFNSFIAGRFDNNKLNSQYNVYKFYDEQLKKFFERYKGKSAMLKNVPMCVFEVAFHNILIDTSITDLSSETFNENYGAKIQRQLDLLIENPDRYIKNPDLLILEDSSGINEGIENNATVEKAYELLTSRMNQLRKHGNVNIDFNEQKSYGFSEFQWPDKYLEMENKKINLVHLNMMKQKIEDNLNAKISKFQNRLAPEERGIFDILKDRILSGLAWLISVFKPTQQTPVSTSKQTFFNYQKAMTLKYKALLQNTRAELDGADDLEKNPGKISAIPN